MPEKEFLIWFTGFWEGEGSFSVYPNNQRRAVFTLGQAKARGYAITKEIQKILGGHVYPNGKSNRKSVQYNWTLYDAFKIEELVVMILPFLRCRKQEVEEKLAVLRENISKRRKRWTDEEDRLLIANKQLSGKELEKLIPRWNAGAIYSRKRLIGIAKFRAAKSKERYLKYRHCRRVCVEN